LDKYGNLREGGGDTVAIYADDRSLGVEDMGDGTYRATLIPDVTGEYVLTAYLGADNTAPQVGTDAAETVTGAPITVAAVALVETGAGEDLDVSVTFTPVNEIPAGGVIRVTFPAG